MKTYMITFEMKENIYCTNLVIAENEESAKAEYGKYEILEIREAANYEIEEAKRKGMPIVTVEKKEESTEAEKAVDHKVSISKGNVKMGAIPSVSLPPIITCKHCEACAKDCYAKRMQRYPSVKNAWQNNLDIVNMDSVEYFNQVSEFCKLQRFFRWHVAGDILGYGYLTGMIEVAKENPHCEFLAFTKNFEDVNAHIEYEGELPKNLHIIFSNWKCFHCENPYNLPTTDILEKGEEVPENGKLCGGNCTECCCRGIGCWELKKGEKLYFYKH